MTIDPKDAKPGEVYLVKYGRETRVGVRNHPDHREPWTLVGTHHSGNLWDFEGDTEVSDLMPLVPARKVTRNDLPSTAWLCRGLPEESEARYWTSHALTKVLEHLNSQGGVPAGVGKSCCGEAALNAAEVDRLTRERDTLQRCVDSWAARGEKAEDDAKWYRDLALKADATIEEAEHERDELQAKLDAAEWLGDVPDKPEVTLDAQTATVGGNTYNVYNHTAKGLRAEAWRNLALADAIEAEEAETNDDEQRIEEQAKALHGELHPFGPSWENTGDYAQRCYITAIRAGWTKEDEK